MLLQPGREHCVFHGECTTDNVDGKRLAGLGIQTRIEGDAVHVQGGDRVVHHDLDVVRPHTLQLQRPLLRRHKS